MDALAWSVLLLALVCFGVFVGWFARGWLKWRGRRLVVCPESGRGATLHVDALQAVGEVGERAGLHVKDCSRWPERSDCGQECLADVKAAPHECLVRTAVNEWCRDKHCAVCDEPVGSLRWWRREPALQDAAGHSRVHLSLPPIGNTPDTVILLTS